MQALAGGQYALAIALAQDSDVNGPNATAAALSAHLAAGGAAWLADFTCEASLAAAFQGGCAEATNQQPVTISDANLAAGVANPLPLTNPGWLTWSWSLTASGEAVPLASFPDGSAAVVLGSKGRSALIGFTADSLTGQNGQRLFGNLLDITVPLPPVIPSFQPPSCSAAVGVQVTVPVPATDANGNLVAVSLAWGDGTEDATASFGPTAAHTATFIHTYAARGLYRIAASATDALGATTSRDAACLMAVYGARDTVLGSGSFDSPAGAFAPDASVAGTATFCECAASGSVLACVGRILSSICPPPTCLHCLISHLARALAPAPACASSAPDRPPQHRRCTAHPQPGAPRPWRPSAPVAASP
jgi:hypothetical protein